MMERNDPYIDWNMSGEEVETESFRRIEEEVGEHPFDSDEWRVIRRLIHTTGDCSVADSVTFRNGPFAAGLAAVREGAPIYCDSRMGAGGISLASLRRFNDYYSESSIHCLVSDPEVARTAKDRGVTRSLVAMEKAQDIVDGGIVLIGNAPLALAALARMIQQKKAMPRLVIGMPVGFVHVLESKALIESTDVPQIVLEGRRGGTPLAVAALHGILK